MDRQIGRWKYGLLQRSKSRLSRVTSWRRSWLWSLTVADNNCGWKTLVIICNHYTQFIIGSYWIGPDNVERAQGLVERFKKTSAMTIEVALTSLCLPMRATVVRSRRVSSQAGGVILQASCKPSTSPLWVMHIFRACAIFNKRCDLFIAQSIGNVCASEHIDRDADELARWSVDGHWMNKYD